MSYEIVTTLTYTEVGKHFPSFTGKCFDIFFNFFKNVFVLQNIEHFKACCYFCIFKLLIMENYCTVAAANVAY